MRISRGQLALIMLLAGNLPALPAFAIKEPRRHVGDLAQPVSEKVVRVASARVILVHYNLVRRDFPSLRSASNAEIDAWILKHAAFVSEPQAAQSTLNTPIQTTPETTLAYRPNDYGRALVFETAEGLIDAKGAGALHPTPGAHHNGLATLGESLREFLYEDLVSRALVEGHSKFDTVRCYAVLDLGFDIKAEDGSLLPAGMVLRQAHDRSTSGSFSGWSDKKSLEVERELRLFGITSAGAYRDDPVEKINIQGTKNEKSLVDFGGFLVVKHFDKPAMNFDGGPVLLDPAATGFVQPDPSLEIPFSIWGYGESGRADPSYDNPWVWSHRLAKALRDGTATRADAEAHVSNMLDPVAKRFKSAVQMECQGRVFSP